MHRKQTHEIEMQSSVSNKKNNPSTPSTSLFKFKIKKLKKIIKQQKLDNSFRGKMLEPREIP